MSKPSAPRRFVPAGSVVVGSVVVGSIVVGSIVALSLLATIAIAVAGGRRLHSRTAIAQHAAAPIQAPALNPEQSATGRASKVRASLKTLPLAFEANQGQTDPQVKYMARANGYTIFLTANDAVFALHSSSQAAASRGTRTSGLAGTKPLPNNDRTAAIHMHLVGGNPQSQLLAGNELPGRSNYFIGNDPSHWHANVAQYSRISYRDAYPGINMAFYGVQKQVEFDFIVAPGASAAPIKLAVTGAQRVATDNSGNLILASSAGDVLLHKPVAYQRKDGARQPVEARFVQRAHHEVSFAIGNYDRTRELVIDPSVSYATYLGGTGEDDGNRIAIDGSGNAYVTGETKSTDFPTKSALYGTYKGGFDVFVTKLSPTGSLVYSTYIGGTGDDSGNGIAVDGSGNVFLAGGTSSSDFPTLGAYQSKFGGVLDAFALELSSTGSTLMYSTYLGGTGSDVANGLALDSSGNAYLAGLTTSTDFPMVNAIQGTIAGTSNGFVAKLNGSGNALSYSTYLGGGSNDFASAVAVDSSNNAYVTGATKNKTFPIFPPTNAFQTSCGTDGNCNGGLYDAFVSVINPAGSGFVYSTFLGGESNDEGLGIAVDSAGDAYVTGFTSSTAFKLKSPLQGTFGGGSVPTDAFVTELNPTGTGLIYSTYLGGSGDDTGLAITVDSNKNAYVTGVTSSTDFKTASATQPAKKGQNDAFVSEIGASGSTLVFSTYLGGSLNENTSTAGGGGSLAGIAVDSAGTTIYVTGSSASSDFPTVAAEQTATGGTGDAFVAKYSLSGTTTGSFTVTNGALSATSGSPGVSATATITVKSVNGFNSAVTLACTIAPVVAEGPTCSFSNPGSSVTPLANSSATATLNVATTAASALLERPSDRRTPSGISYAMLLPICGITLLGAGLGSAGSPRRNLFGFLILGMILCGMLLMPACGGSSGTKTGNPGTPAGTYTITVTGTSGSTVTGSPTLTLTVN